MRLLIRFRGTHDEDGFRDRNLWSDGNMIWETGEWVDGGIFFWNSD